MPKRIQRKRTKGWKMPNNAVSVTRNGKYGNWYKVGDQVMEYDQLSEQDQCLFPNRTIVNAEGAILLFNKFQVDRLDLSLLRGKDLACFCDLKSPCHADILLELANK